MGATGNILALFVLFPAVPTTAWYTPPLFRRGCHQSSCVHPNVSVPGQRTRQILYQQLGGKGGADESSLYNRQFDANEQDTLEMIMRSRRDVRGNRFSDVPVEQPVLDKILNAAGLAPSVGFSQPWEFVKVNNLETRLRIVDSFKRANSEAEGQFKDEKQLLYARLKLEGIQEAPVNIAVFYRPSKLPVLGQTSMEEMGRYSVVCAIQNMWLMARALNVGLGWVSILDPEDVKEALNAPEDAELVAYLCLGYVKEFLSQPELEALKWGERKSMETCVLEESY